MPETNEQNPNLHEAEQDVRTAFERLTDVMRASQGTYNNPNRNNVLELVREIREAGNIMALAIPELKAGR